MATAARMAAKPPKPARGLRKIHIPDHPADAPSLQHSFAQQRTLIGCVAVFGFFVNLLILTGPIFALQVYDRVLGSRSVETLVAPSILMAFLFLIMDLLDHARKRIAARIGERLVSRIDRPAFLAMRRSGSQSGLPTSGPLDDLEILRQFFGSSVFMALFDLPWLPVFLVAITLFHPALGWLAGIGAVVILLPGVLTLAFGGTDTPAGGESLSSSRAWAQLAGSSQGESFGLDFAGTVFDGWRAAHRAGRLAALSFQDKKAVIASITQTFRLILQSAVIALGAYLVLQDQLTPGAIIATSVLLARALAPADLVSQNAGAILQVRAAWRRLGKKHANGPYPGRKAHTLRPDLGLSVDQLTVFPPGGHRAVLRLVTFALGAGQSIGVTGPSGAGKSALAKALIGQCPITGGSIRFGGVPVARIAEADRFANMGYLPQELRFHDGSIAQNICNFGDFSDTDSVTRAASLAGAHDTIMALADGYHTHLSPAPGALLAGLLQKIGLARAIHGEPALVILDEPANNLDADGLRALHAIVASTAASGRAVLVFSQRQGVLAGCQKILLLQNGMQQNPGPRGMVAGLSGGDIWQLAGNGAAFRGRHRRGSAGAGRRKP